MTKQSQSLIAGTGSYLPTRTISNEELACLVDTSHDWIVKRTGIRSRHIADDSETTTDLAVHAARAALDDAGLTAQDVDLIVLATATPDDTFPATAVKVQRALGMTQGAAFDVQAVCTGFVYALGVADSMLRCGHGRVALVIGAEIFSRILDWEDRGTCVLFGDGAGAVVMQGEPIDAPGERRGVLSTHLFSDGRYREDLYVDGGVSSTGTAGHLRMNGREVFKHAVKNMADAIEIALESNDLKQEEVDWLVPHQANKRIIEATAKRFGLSMDRVVLTVDDHANTSAASIPLALDSANRRGAFRPGDLLVLEAMGGGFTWGSAAIRWTQAQD